MAGGGPDAERIAALYRRFADVEAAGVSDVFFDWASSISADPVVLALIAELPDGRMQPNLVFAAARSLGAPAGPYGTFRTWLVEHWPDVAEVARTRSTQTNEAGRCAVLLPVLADLAGPLSLIEVGASAGLCLHPDRYSYRYRTPQGEVALDPASGPSPVVLRCELAGAAAPVSLPEIAWRAGIDLAPLDPSSASDARWLRTLVWPEHAGRRERLDAALRTAAAERAEIVAGDLVDALPDLIARAPTGSRVVVMHSAVLVYLEPARRRRFADLMRGLPEVTWVSNEREHVLERIAARLPGPVGGRSVLSVDEMPIALVGPHGQSYEALPPSPRTMGDSPPA